MKIGEMVRHAFLRLCEANVFEQKTDLLEKLCDVEYCKIHFELNTQGVSFPLFLKEDSEKDVNYGTTQRRFYTENNFNCVVNGQRYYLCSQLYERQTVNFEKWFLEELHINFKVLLDLEHLYGFISNDHSCTIFLGNCRSYNSFSDTILSCDKNVTVLSDYIKLMEKMKLSFNILPQQQDMKDGYYVYKIKGKPTLNFIQIDKTLKKRGEDAKELKANLLKLLNSKEFNNTNNLERNMIIPLLGFVENKVSAIVSADAIVDILYNYSFSVLSSVVIDIAWQDMTANELSSLSNYFHKKMLDKEEELVRSEVSFFLDSVTCEDLLGRKPLASYLVSKIKELVNKNDKELNNGSKKNNYDESFMVHLSGSWGTGKSSFLEFLSEDFVKNNWTVVRFNCWQYQYYIPSWWGIITVIDKQLKSSWDISDYCCYYVQKTCDGIKGIFSAEGIVIVIILIILTMLISFVVWGICSVFKDLTYDFSKVSIGSSLFSALAIFLKNRTLMNQVGITLGRDSSHLNEAKSNASYLVSRYFKKLIYFHTKRKNKNVVMFIDDLDRCKSKTSVELLEGIQTLFREAPIVYVISSDKSWLVKSFEIEHGENGVPRQGTSLGMNYLEKIFQLTVRLPNIGDRNEKAFSQYLHGDILGTHDHNDKLPNRKKAHRLDFGSIYNQIKGKIMGVGHYRSEDIAEASTKQAVSSPNNKDNSLDSNKIYNNLRDKVKKERRHVLSEFSRFIGNNPRIIKRFLNTYEINRYINLLENDLRENKANEKQKECIIYWSFIQQEWPLFLERCIEHLGNRDKRLCSPNTIINLQHTKNDDLKFLNSDSRFSKIKEKNILQEKYLKLFLGINE